jgi:hypothetical protein
VHPETYTQQDREEGIEMPSRTTSCNRRIAEEEHGKEKRYLQPSTHLHLPTTCTVPPREGENTQVYKRAS